MTTSSSYQYSIPKTIPIISSHDHPMWVIRDGANEQAELELCFRDSYEIFKIRVRELGNMKKPTPEPDADALRVMLDGLILAKQLFQK